MLCGATGLRRYKPPWLGVPAEVDLGARRSSGRRRLEATMRWNFGWWALAGATLGCGGSVTGESGAASTGGVAEAANTGGRAGQGATGGSGGTSASCLYDGLVYAPGASIPCANGCGSCFCLQDGLVRATLSGCPTTDSAVVACEYDGVVYPLGASFACDCNECWCAPDGIMSTLMGCLADGGGPTRCDYDGTSYSVGSTFPPTNGCGSCACSHGVVQCELKACAACFYNGTEYPVSASFPATDGCNTCQCFAGGNVACTLVACG